MRCPSLGYWSKSLAILCRLEHAVFWSGTCVIVKTCQGHFTENDIEFNLIIILHLVSSRAWNVIKVLWKECWEMTPRERLCWTYISRCLASTSSSPGRDVNDWHFQPDAFPCFNFFSNKIVTFDFKIWCAIPSSKALPKADLMVP